jgi:two-component system cell cycle response regulator
VPIVAVTAFAMPGDREKAMAASFDGYVSKPIAPERFLETLDRFLPRDKHAVKRTTPPPSASPAASRPARGTVLVVDDSFVNRRLVRSTLEPLGYRVVTADSAERALDAAACDDIDLVLTDLHMPGSDGMALLRRLKAGAQTRDLPVIVISSTASGPAANEWIGHGASRFLTRPIEPRILIDEVESVINRHDEVRPCRAS